MQFTWYHLSKYFKHVNFNIPNLRHLTSFSNRYGYWHLEDAWVVLSQRESVEELVIVAFFVSKVVAKLVDVLKEHLARLCVITFNCVDVFWFYMKMYVAGLIYLAKDQFSKYCDWMCIFVFYICEVVPRENYTELLDAITQPESGLTKPALLRTLSIVHRHPLGPDMRRPVRLLNANSYDVAWNHY